MKPESIENTYQGPLELDRLPKALKILNMGICFVLATAIAISNYSRILNNLHPVLFGNSLNWLTWISPVCIAVAWLRLTGVRWRYALLLFIFVPAVLLLVQLIFSLLAGLLMGD